MTVSVSSYILKTAEFTEVQLKAILSYAVGFNPRLVTMELSPGEYAKVKLEEKSLGAFQRSEDAQKKITTEENLAYITAQLDSWAGSGSSGNGLAERAAEVIRALAEKINSLENEGK